MNETLLLMIGPVFHGGDVAAVPRYGGGGYPIRGSRVAANRSGEGFGARPEGGVAAAPFFSSLKATLCTAAYMSERQPVLEVREEDGMEGREGEGMGWWRWDGRGRERGRRVVMVLAEVRGRQISKVFAFSCHVVALTPFSTKRRLNILEEPKSRRRAIPIPDAR